MAVMTVMPLSAKKTVEKSAKQNGKVQPKEVKEPKEVAGLSVEQEQQFTYYWYSAKEALAQEKYDEGLVLLEFCRLIKPNDGQTLTFLAILYDAMGQKERAMETFRLAFEADPHDQWARYAYALEQLRTEEGYTEALAVLERAYNAQKPKVEEDLLEQLRRMYLRHAQWAKAIAIQDEIDRLKGFDGYSAVNRFQTYRSWGKFKKAFAALDKYLELDPNNVQILVMRLELMEGTGVKQAELYAMYDRILELAPGHVYVLNNYAYRLATDGGDLQKAEQMSAMTLREEPTNPLYLDTYGWIMHLKGQDELALFYLRRALTNIEQAGPMAKRVQGEIEKHIKQIKK